MRQKRGKMKNGLLVGNNPFVVCFMLPETVTSNYSFTLST